jgi:hypothetical protein
VAALALALSACGGRADIVVSGDVDGGGSVVAGDEASLLEASAPDATRRSPSGEAGSDDAAPETNPVGDAQPHPNVGDAPPALDAGATLDATVADAQGDVTSSSFDGGSAPTDATAIGILDAASDTTSSAVDGGLAPADATTLGTLDAANDATSSAIDAEGEPADATTVRTLDASVPADDGRVFNEPPCNTVDYAAAPWVVTAYVDAALPVMTGGAVVSGTYYLTSDTVYGPPCVVTSVPWQEVVVIVQDVGNPTSGTFLSAGQSQFGHRDDGNAIYSTDGGLFSASSACTSPVWSGPSVGTAPYSATLTELVLESLPTSCQLEISVYTKQ